jgi:hypothetical protein
MPKKKSSKPKINIQQGQATAKAHVKNLQKMQKKLKLDLRKIEKGLSNRCLAWHKG